MSAITNGATDLEPAEMKDRGLARALLAKHAFEAFNVGAGQGILLNQIVEAACRTTGRSTPLVNADRHHGDSPYALASTGRAGHLPGLTPTFTDVGVAVGPAWQSLRRGLIDERPRGARQDPHSSIHHH